MRMSQLSLIVRRVESVILFLRECGHHPFCHIIETEVANQRWRDEYQVWSSDCLVYSVQWVANTQRGTMSMKQKWTPKPC